MTLAIDPIELYLVVVPPLFATVVSALLLAILWFSLPERERITGVLVTGLVGVGSTTLIVSYLLPTGEKVGPFPAIIFGSAAAIASILLTGLLLFVTAAWRSARRTGRAS